MAMSDIGGYVFTVLLASLFIVCIIGFVTGTAIKYGDDPKDYMHDSLRNNALESDLTEQQETYNNSLWSVKKDDGALKVGVILLKSVWTAGTQIVTSITTLSGSILGIFSDLFGIPSIVLGSIVSLIFISLILGLWSLIKSA